jgi:quercetin dioxygenase-like cupin family protein
MNNVKKIALEPSSKKDNGVWVMQLDPLQVKVEGVVMQEVSLVQIPPGEAGGNHKHPRVEVFACLAGELQLSWLEDGEQQEEMMEQVGEKLTAYVIPAGLPHAVKNVGQTLGFLLEYASEKQRGVIQEELV